MELNAPLFLMISANFLPTSHMILINDGQVQLKRSQIVLWQKGAATQQGYTTLGIAIFFFLS